MEITEVSLNVNDDGTVCQPFARVAGEVVAVDIAIVDDTSGGIASPGIRVDGDMWRLPFKYELGEKRVHAEVSAFGADGTVVTKSSGANA